MKRVCVCVCVCVRVCERENERERERERKRTRERTAGVREGSRRMRRENVFAPHSSGPYPLADGRENKFFAGDEPGGICPRLKAQKTTQNGCCRAGVVPNPEFTPRNVPHYQSFLILARGRPKRDPLRNILFAFPPKGGRGSESTVTAMPCLLLEDL